MVVLYRECTARMDAIVQPAARLQARMYANVVCVVCMCLFALDNIHPFGVETSVPCCIHTDWTTLLYQKGVIAC